MTLEELNKITNSTNLVMVDFYADWCGPCKMMGMILPEVEKQFEDKMTVVKVNIEESEEIVKEYGITSIPTIFMFKDGLIAKMASGFQPKPVLVKMVEDLL